MNNCQRQTKQKNTILFENDEFCIKIRHRVARHARVCLVRLSGVPMFRSDCSLLRAHSLRPKSTRCPVFYHSDFLQRLIPKRSEIDSPKPPQKFQIYIKTQP